MWSPRGRRRCSARRVGGAVEPDLPLLSGYHARVLAAPQHAKTASGLDFEFLNGRGVRDSAGDIHSVPGSEQDSEILSPLFGTGFGLREGAEPPPPGERQRRIHLVQIGSGVLAQLRRYAIGRERLPDPARSEEHTSELQSLMRISYAVFCLKKKNTKHKTAPLPAKPINQH